MESGVSFTSLDPAGEDRFQRLRAELGEPLLLLAVGGATEHEGRDGRAYESWDETGEGRPPQEVPLPD